MKKYIFNLFFFLLISSFAFAQSKMFQSQNGNVKVEAKAAAQPIVSNGLVMSFDPGNSASYPGSGATLFDLSGNSKNSSLINSPVYSGANGGILVFNNYNYIQVPSLTWRSIGMFVKMSTSQGSPYYLMDGRDGVVNSYYYSADPAGTAFTKLYVNGVSQPSLPVLSNTTIFPKETWLYIYLEISALGTDNINIFSRYSNNEFLKASIGAVQVYNVPLTEQEILANFNAQKARYGL
jgi:hypothetical protein